MALGGTAARLPLRLLADLRRGHERRDELHRRRQRILRAARGRPMHAGRSSHGNLRTAFESQATEPVPPFPPAEMVFFKGPFFFIMVFFFARSSEMSKESSKTRSMKETIQDSESS